MATKSDLKYVFHSLTAGGGDVATVIAETSTVSAVPTGRTRFITYLRLERTSVASAGSTVTGTSGVLATVSTASNISSYASAIVSSPKLGLGTAWVVGGMIASTPTIPDVVVKNECPKRPSINHPIVSCAGGTCPIFMVASTNASLMLYAAYYDEPASI